MQKNEFCVKHSLRGGSEGLPRFARRRWFGKGFAFSEAVPPGRLVAS
jgi:hypothetical protein